MNDKYLILTPELQSEILKALSFYPELKNYGIRFQYRKISQKSFMLAQPMFRTLLFPRRYRKYKIIINKAYFTQNKKLYKGKVPSDIVIGWIGHELGHIMDYIHRSSFNLIWFGFKYSTDPKFVMKAEIAADKNAVKAGLIDYLVISKEFGRNPAYFEQAYIDKLNSLYPSVATVKQWDIEFKKGQL